MRFTALFSVFAAALFLGCNKQTVAPSVVANHSIRGQVFVIQKNRLNVKLGGVDVYYVPMTEFRKRCAWISSERGRASEIKSYKETMGRIDDWLTDAGVAPSASKLRTFFSNASELQMNAHSKFLSNPEISEFEKIESLRKSNTELFENSEIAGNETCQWIATCLFLEWMDRNSGHTSKTDADGNFSITITKSMPGVIMMNSSRQLVGGGFENYYWLKEIKGDEIDPLIFSSHDTVSGGFLLEIVRQAAEPTRSSQKIIQDEFGLVDLEWFSKAKTIFSTISEGDTQIKTLENQIRKLEGTIGDIRYASEQ